MTARPPAGSGPIRPIAPAGPVDYGPPVDGIVVDPFRPPLSPWGPGNRGIELVTAAGAPVVAAADGTVTFAGPVAGSLHVTILHADGLRTSYSFLASVEVVVGSSIPAGHRLGTSTGSIHIGVRSGSVYLDPSFLWDAAPQPPPVPVLAPDAVGPTPTEREALIAISGMGLTLSIGGSGVHFGLDDRGRAWRHWIGDLSATDRVDQVVARFGSWWVSRRACTADDREVDEPGERRIAVLVGGLGSSSRSAAVDRVQVEALGYDPGDVVRFSYPSAPGASGARIPGPVHPDLAPIPTAAYDRADSQRDLPTAAIALGDLVGQVAAGSPGVPVDLYAHSQGGVVVQLLLASTPTSRPPTLDLVATMGSPHDGADLATALDAISTSGGGRAGLTAIAELLDIDLDPTSVAADQLAESSELMATLAAREVPDDVRAISLGARGDLTVPEPHTLLPGSRHVSIPLAGTDAHTLLPGDPATTRELQLALVGLDPRCREPLDVLTDIGTGTAISFGQDLLGAGMSLAIG